MAAYPEAKSVFSWGDAKTLAYRVPPLLGSALRAWAVEFGGPSDQRASRKTQ